jgi:intracellular multiplication protein IcmG
MVDNEKKIPDEYKYPSEEYYKAHPESRMEGEITPRRSTMSRRVLIFLGLLIAIAVVYLILTITTRKPTETGQIAVVPQKPAVLTQPKPQAITVAPSQPEAAMTRSLQQLTEQTQNNQQAIAALQTQLQQLQSELSQITNSVTMVTTQIQALAGEVRSLAKERALSQAKQGLRAPKVTLYHLKALVPGRAWLQSPKGHMTTVTIGDRLPGYGIIQMINTEQGIVTTSSGAIIQYGAKDG